MTFQDKIKRRWLDTPVRNEELNKLIEDIIKRFEAVEDRLEKLEHGKR